MSRRSSVCKVRTQDPENFDEEVKSLVTAWRKRGQAVKQRLDNLFIFVLSGLSLGLWTTLCPAFYSFTTVPDRGRPSTKRMKDAFLSFSPGPHIEKTLGPGQDRNMIESRSDGLSFSLSSGHQIQTQS